MGDFLGATICITELIILCTIHAFPVARILRDIVTKSAVQLWLDWLTYGRIDLFSVTTLPIADSSLMKNNSLFRIILVLIFVYVWSYLMNLARRMKSSRNDNVTEDTNVAFEDFSVSKEASFSERFDEAQRYIDSLAKPVGSLGTLEKYAAR